MEQTQLDTSAVKSSQSRAGNVDAHISARQHINDNTSASDDITAVAYFWCTLTGAGVTASDSAPNES